MKNNDTEKGAFNDYSKLVRETKKNRKHEQEIAAKILELLKGEEILSVRSILQRVETLINLNAVVSTNPQVEMPDFLEGVFTGFSDFQSSSDKLEKWKL